MAAVTLGQMLETALGSSRAGIIDFEQLHNLLNGLLLHLGLRDLLVQENGEPLEGAEESPFAFLKELKQRLEANEKELAEYRTLCQELREEVTEMKAEQARVAEDMQKIMENFDAENFQKMMEDLRKQLLDAVMSSMKDQDDGWMDGGRRHTRSWDDPGLIVIGNEITLLERTPISRHGDTRPSSPLSPSAKTQGREKDLLEANASSHTVSSKENDTGQNVGQSDMERNMGRRGVGWSAGQSDLGQKGKGWNVRSSDTGRSDMGQIKDEEIKTSISKTPPPSERKSPNGSFTTSGMHPGAPGTHLPGQRVESAQGQPGSQSPWIPAESGAGISSRPPTSKEAHGGGSSRTEPFPAEDGLMLLKVPSSEYSPCDQLVQLPGPHSEIIPSTPPPSPGLSGRLPRTPKKSHPHEHRLEGYSRRSPMYCGGKHTSICPTQPMEPLLPDPNKPGVIELVGTDGLVYRGRTAPGTDSPRDSSPQK